jgi:prepilin-type N-terminal cleavage/methylation domain-containing protein
MISVRTISPRAFTLVELMVSMSIGTVVMLAVFNTYNYLGRNLTRLSYRSMLETQARKIVGDLSSDLRTAVAVNPSTNPTGSSLTLLVPNMDPTTKATTPTYQVIYSFDLTTRMLTRTTTDPKSFQPTTRNGAQNDPGITDETKRTLPARMTGFSFNYYNGSGTTLISPAAPMSIKQVAVTFTLEPEGDPVRHRQLGTYTFYPVNTSRLVLNNRQAPDGT